MTALFATLADAAPIDQQPAIPFPSDPEPDEVRAPPLIEPDQGVPELNEAKQAFEAGDLKLCQDKLRAAYAKHPNIAPPKLLLANMLVSSGQMGLGRALLEEVAVAHPGRPELYLLFGQLALRDGHVTDAALQFEKALSMPIPADWNDEQRQYLERAVAQGRTVIAERRGDWSAAAKLYQQQIEADSKNAALRDRYATALFRGRELERAYEQFDIAHLQDNTMNPPEVSMAVMFVQQGDYNKADQWFDKALASHGEDPQVHFERSIALLYADRTDEADTHAAKAAELGMDSPLLSMHRGLVAMQKGDSAAAQRQLDEALKKSPENVGAMSNLALVLVEQKDKAARARAVELAEAAGRLRPASPEVAAVLGWVYYRTGQMEKGEPLLRAAAAMPTADPLPLFLYARMLVLQDQGDDARQAAQLLAQRIEQPGLFVLRPMARKWLATVLKM